MLAVNVSAKHWYIHICTVCHRLYSRDIAISDFHHYTVTKTGISQDKSWSFPNRNPVFFYALTKPEHWHSVVMIKTVSTCLWFCRNVHLFCRSGWRTMSNETNLYWSPVGEIQSDTAAKSVQTTQYNKQQVEFTMTKVKENKITYTNKWRKGERGAPPLPLFTVAQSTTAH